jgi:hypothetical protein
MRGGVIVMRWPSMSVVVCSAPRPISPVMTSSSSSVADWLGGSSLACTARTPDGNARMWTESANGTADSSATRMLRRVGGASLSRPVRGDAARHNAPLARAPSVNLTLLSMTIVLLG